MLMLQPKPGITPDQVRRILRAIARDLGPKGPGLMYGAGFANAYGALMAETAPPLAAGSRPLEPASAGAR